MKKKAKPVSKEPGSRAESELIAGKTHVPDQTVDGLRFVLTSTNFKTIKAEFADPEMQDTIRLIEELRRRLVLIAQNESKDYRRISYQRLAQEIDELFLDSRLIQQVVPSGALKHLESERKALAGLRRLF